jgi:hypothetical protein
MFFYDSQNKAIISRNNFNLFVFVMKTRRVFCEVGTEFLNTRIREAIFRVQSVYNIL